MSVKQVRPYDRWPSGESQAIATLSLEPDELAARYGLAFEEGSDDLDLYRLAAVALADGSQVWLMRHRGNPVPGTVVYADAHADAEVTRTSLAQTLGLHGDRARWLRSVSARWEDVA